MGLGRCWPIRSSRIVPTIVPRKLSNAGSCRKARSGICARRSGEKALSAFANADASKNAGVSRRRANSGNAALFLIDVANFLISHVAFLLHANFLVAHGVAHVAVVLDLPLPDSHFFGDDRLLFHPNLLFGERNANFFVAGFEAAGRGFAALNRIALDDQFLARDRHLDVLVFGDHFLAESHLAALHPILLDTENFAVQENALIGGRLEVPLGGNVFASRIVRYTRRVSREARLTQIAA